MDLTTTYAGLKLKNPLMPGASPLVDNTDAARRIEDAGAAAVVMHSLFAEQIEGNEIAFARHVERWQDNFAEATSFFPAQDDYSLPPNEYVECIGKLKAALHIPVIASLNGTQLGSWHTFAQQIEQAGADALELNTYFLATRREVTGTEIEQRIVEITRAVRSSVKIPVLVKLSPYYSALPNLAGALEQERADGIVLFNRFFQPEIDVDTLDVTPRLDLSTHEDLRLRLRALAVLRDQVKFSLACSGGVHTWADVVKAILAGADAVQVVATLLSRGPERIGDLLTGLRDWMEEHEYTSIAEMRGSLSQLKCPDPEAYERGNYLRTLQLWKE
ncbi:MAG: dihydroorotate dehydrogenase-like protein [Opitutaceae bacterium]|nr:dihydroorotate dehydrogenase-like protein [Opitutaceae bacterium]